MTTTKTFLITNRIACTILGFFEAASEDDAVLAMIRDAGYRDAQHEAEVLDSTVEKLRDELVVTEVNLAATVKEIAEAMVAADRESGDVEPEVLDDPAAGDPSNWDATPLRAYIADATNVDRALVAAIARDYMHLVHHAYGRAWRAAVELDLAARDEVAS
jgi:hypothetical protein